MHITRRDMTLTGNLADAPIVTAGFGADGVALQRCTATAATGDFGDADRTARRHVRLQPRRVRHRRPRLRFNVAVTGVTP